MGETILIVTSSIDGHAYEPVRRELNRNGYDSTVYLTDEVLSGKAQYHMSVTADGLVEAAYNTTPIGPDDIGAAWMRKPGSYQRTTPQDDIAREHYLRGEIALLHEAVWTLYPEHVWLNNPDSIRKADRKLGQLVAAKNVGFQVPHTVIANQWGDVEATLINGEEDLVAVKMVRGVISAGNQRKAMYATVLDKDRISRLNELSPFPGLYQPFLKKRKEWRVTVVGDDVFSASIYTESDAKDDWRRHQHTDAVQFKEEQLQEDIAEKCIKYNGVMGLRFGAFDLVETPDHGTFFLECNPNGQYGWLEKQLGFPISNRIAKELISIATTSYPGDAAQ